MTLKLTIGFLFSTLLLVVCEYILLSELFSSKRTLVVIVSLLGVMLASLFFLFFFTKYRKTLKDS